MERRILTGKTSKVGVEDREKLRAARIAERARFEKTRTGGYELIFPCEQDPEAQARYEEMI